MSRTTTFWVLWVSLLLLVPLPVYRAGWASLPVAYLATSAGAPLLLLQAGIGAFALWVLARSYCRWTVAWQDKIRGAVMAIAVLAAITVFASVPVYRTLPQSGGEPMTFQWLYE